MTSSRLFALLAAALLGGQLPGQSTNFEVASVRPSDPKDHTIGLSNFPGGRVKMTHYTLQMMAEVAYDLREFQISGGPAWVREEPWTIDTKPPRDSKSAQADTSHTNIRIPLNTEQRAMLQGLLAERFHLTAHRETKKDASVYFLRRSDQPIKLTPAKDTSQLPWVGGPLGGKILGDGLAATNASAAFLASRLSIYVKRVVVDQTELPAAYDFRIDYNGQYYDVQLCIQKGIHDLGLKLDPGRSDIETLVIDRAEKASAN
jgi:uncharacterized protein (TIGR03435 family)